MYPRLGGSAKNLNAISTNDPRTGCVSVCLIHWRLKNLADFQGQNRANTQNSNILLLNNKTMSFQI